MNALIYAVAIIFWTAICVTNATASVYSTISYTSDSIPLVDTAGVAWKRIADLKREVAVADLAWQDTIGQRLREEGLLFYYTHPNDPRRWKWVLWTVDMPPLYYTDWKQAKEMYLNDTPWLIWTDTIAKLRGDSIWNEKFPAIRAELMASGQVTEDMRRTLKRVEANKGRVAMRNAILHGERITSPNLRSLQEQLLEDARLPNSSALYYVNWFTNPTVRHYDPVAARDFISAAKISPDTEVARWAVAKERLLYDKTPLVLRGKSLTGKTIDLKQYHGKVVLLDFWSLGCKGCITSFPWLKQQYEKFRSNGFEIIGVVLSDESDKKAVRQLVAKYQLPWLQLFPGQNSHKLAQDLAVFGVPAHLVLDRNGRVVESGTLTRPEIIHAIEEAFLSTEKRPDSN